MAVPMEIAGEKFGRLTAVERVGYDKHGKAQWQFICECGTSKVLTGSEVKQGKVSSCGCLGNETRGINSRSNREKIAAAKLKHGHAILRSPEYAIWKTMRQRCLNPRCVDYPDYGGRGITICDRWDDFASFYADMGPRPSSRHSLDRRENDRGYEPDNCRWAEPVEQARNRRPRRKTDGNLHRVAA